VALPTGRLAVRRLAAFAVDWLVIAAYAAVLSLLASPVLRPAFTRTAWQSEGLGFTLLTLPVVLYVAGSEASSWHASIGKRLLRLRVTAGSAPMTWRRSLVRSAVKFVPWELGHFVVWHVFVLPDRIGRTAGPALLVAANLLPLVYLGCLFVGAGRTPYDAASGTAVEIASRG
jgi:uncharacterized RDD family membrane protein YckC